MEQEQIMRLYEDANKDEEEVEAEFDAGELDADAAADRIRRFGDIAQLIGTPGWGELVNVLNDMLESATESLIGAATMTEVAASQAAVRLLRSIIKMPSAADAERSKIIASQNKEKSEEE